MSKLSSNVNAFFYRNRSKGIPKLMLWVGIANILVYVTYLLNRSDPLFFTLLCFERQSILSGQVWRLLTYPFVYLTVQTSSGSSLGALLGVLMLLFYYYCGSVLENVYGRLRSNLFYLCGVLLTGVAGILIGFFTDSFYYHALNFLLVDASFVNLSLLLAVAAVQPDSMVRIYFVIPLKMKWLAWIDVGFMLYRTVRTGIELGFDTFLWLLPLVALGNFALFFGKSAANLLPDFLRGGKSASERKTAHAFRAAAQPRPTVRVQQPYRFKCTVCGRTDVSDPKLEFRYCSRCAGYRCYCMDHINNHAHITE